MKKTVCVGVGSIGRAWAVVFAKAGHEVALYDANADVLNEVKERIESTLGDLEAAGLLHDAHSAINNIRIAETLEDALVDAVYVQESVRELLEVKRATFEEIACYAPEDAIIASSTSAIAGSLFMEGLRNSANCLVAHPTNPPFLTTLTELCPTSSTSIATLKAAKKFLTGCGQATVTLKKEITGYALNRLQAAVVAEALYLVGEGYLSAPDLDDVMTRGLGMRWCFMGPFLTGHLNAPTGYAQYMNMYGDAYRSIVRDLRTDYEWTPRLFKKVQDQIAGGEETADVASQQAWRDRRLMLLIKHLEEADRIEPRKGQIYEA
ncbi:3-hydroxyacyl-CoA dehydrogenase NAD-binding domain-containing protein [Hyphococcus flavus]|uniref:3-hydroxyacyl-CoA dehydrogenase NAD-binding domain-containing protein n=1 Tax=Hyphococcus flavus TaxID=1866326 RepID=A0AAE9ZCW5_9PROT|nr:3-hydroxyacyl-CoA dehydrogenase NAD-binding domain-containing protein [Hyphococcus flavus]WDI30137.1 3-hydroxyacyl-CoA dehydrogenase NAD-binding domain-containing protein [Hyphococcus flavus]